MQYIRYEKNKTYYYVKFDNRNLVTDDSDLKLLQMADYCVKDNTFQKARETISIQELEDNTLERCKIQNSNAESFTKVLSIFQRHEVRVYPSEQEYVDATAALLKVHYRTLLKALGIASIADEFLKKFNYIAAVDNS